jgi:predicted flap endonuclease-1-like 5' DNA nuclease
MNPVFIFILGLLVGWLIEWIIDWFYWRTRYAERDTGSSEPPVQATAVPPRVVEQPRPQARPAPDNLQVIKGIGPVIERKLNEAGITTFEQLGNLTAADLRRILGDVIERLSDEEALLQQARDLARRK